MKVVNISKKRFENLERYQLPDSVFNSEAQMYVLPIKNRWEIVNKLLKRLYVTSGPLFGNKLQTLNSLIDLQDDIDIPEIVFPQRLAVVNCEVVGYVMELVDSINIEVALRSENISSMDKIRYLRQVGEILEKMRKVRKYTDIKDFYLNDIHENNFVIDRNTDSVRVVDIDSCKINGNYTFGSRYLSPMSIIANNPKYKREENGICGGFIKPSEDSELYCYIIMILNTLYGGGFNRLSLEEFNKYLEYLYSICVDLELINIFEEIVSNQHNQNPYELLDSLVPIVGRSNKNVYNYVRKK